MTLPILGTSVVSKEAMKQLLSQRNPNPPMEVIDLYYELESMWGLRADVLIGQMFHETDFLKSWWSQPPRRNMAGIGVTGEVTNSDPQSVAWAIKTDDNRWYKGYSFGDWRAAVLAHYGHMSAYCYADERNHASQIDPRYSAARGAFAAKGWPLAQVMTDLNGKWAVPGTGYGENIEKILNTAAPLGGTASAMSAPSAPAPNAGPNPPTFPAPAIIDLTAKTPDSVYTPSRAPYNVKVLVLHDTVGSDAAPDSNELGLDANGYQNRLNGTISWFQGGGGISVHYLIGPEALGGKIYRLCPESGVAYHAGGSPGFPSTWTAPDGTHYEGRFNGVGIMNYISLGIERWGSVSETPGPNQTRSMISLVTDIARRYSLSTDQIVPHKLLEGDRTDGVVLLTTVRNAVTQMWAAIAAASQPAQPAPAPVASAPQDTSHLVVPVPLHTAPEPTPIKVLPPISIPDAAPAAPPVQPVPDAPAPTPAAPVEAPAPAPAGSNWTEGVDGVTASLGAGTVANGTTLVRAKPRLDAEVVRSIDVGTSVRWSFYTDSGSDAGVGPRWYLLDDADGGGWVYSGSID